jgi:hypothetical protein
VKHNSVSVSVTRSAWSSEGVNPAWQTSACCCSLPRVSQLSWLGGQLSRGVQGAEKECLLSCCAGAAASGPPAGAVPTFSVTRLPELTQVLKNTAPTAANMAAMAAAETEPTAAAATAGSIASSSTSNDSLSSIDGLDPGSVALLGWSLRSGSMDSMSSMSSGEEDSGVLGMPLDPHSPGAPAAGLDFFDFLVDQGAVQTATTSFPRMGECRQGCACCCGGCCMKQVGCV